MPGNTKSHLWERGTKSNLWERDKNIKESDDKPTSGQQWNALNTLIETKTLARGIIHDSSDWVNHLTDILKELAKLDIKNQDGSQVPILASDGKTKGLHSLARKLKAKTGKEPYIPKDRIRGTIIVGTTSIPSGICELSIQTLVNSLNKFKSVFFNFKRNSLQY